MKLFSHSQTAAIEGNNSGLGDHDSIANDERVLVIAPLGRDATAISELLNENGFKALICADPSKAADAVPHAGALVMTEETLEFAQTSNLLAALGRQPPWSELPLIILTSGGASRLARLLDLAARAARSVTLLERPINGETLLRTMNVALRSRRRQYQVRDLMADQERSRAQLETSEKQLRSLLTRERDLRKAADAANKLKDEFLATISHELRNPLNVFLGYSELLLRMKEIRESPELTRISEALRRNALAQSYLIRDLLELSRLRSGKLTLSRDTISIRTAIDNAIETVRADAEAKQIRIHVEAKGEPLFVTGDLLRLEQIVWNLLSNAVKFTPAGGDVSIQLNRTNTGISLIVEDSGQGIEPEFLPHVFEMFRQGDTRVNRAHAGLGIGLALVHQLVKLHQGSIQCYSEGPGKGTRFTVLLPEAIVRNGDTVVQTTPDADNGLHQITVLAVDDDVDNTTLIRLLLELSNAKVITANSGLEALEIASQSEFDIVLSDLSMPGMDGFEFVRRLRFLPGKENVPVIALTGFGRHEDIQQARSEGFVAHLTKPIDVKALLKILHELSNNLCNE